MTPGEYAFLRELHPMLWLAWLLYWIISARGLKRTTRRETVGERLPYTLPLALGVALFSFPRDFPLLSHPLYTETFLIYGIGTALLIAGLGFSIWARSTLGANWSGTVTVKENHELIQTGPYRLVRHPIYSGMLLGLIGSAMAQHFLSSYLALGLIFLSFWVKLLREEAWMRETFGEAYAAYCGRTPRLIPFAR